MADKMIDYDAADTNRPTTVMVDKILHLSKESETGHIDSDEDVTIIHLVNGDKLRSLDSIRTLQARINSD